jgi:opacity protein-like surface antigen
MSRPVSGVADTAKNPGSDHRPNDWSGAYFGASFGGIISRSRVTSSDVYTQNSPGSAAPFNVIGYRTSSTGAWSNGGGVTLDLYGGMNAQIDSLLIGLQVEGSLANATFRSPGVRRYDYFDGNGLTGQVASGSFRPQVHGRWMASALARVGWLADMSTLLYAIGGWTVGGFEYRNVIDNLFLQPTENFIAHGVAVGIGVEKKIERNWTVRAEYRFAHFFPETVSNTFLFGTTTPPLTAQSFSAETRFENQTHTIRLGLSRQISAP